MQPKATTTNVVENYLKFVIDSSILRHPTQHLTTALNTKKLYQAQPSQKTGGSVYWMLKKMLLAKHLVNFEGNILAKLLKKIRWY
jgi:hypothetical protein